MMDKMAAIRLGLWTLPFVFVVFIVTVFILSGDGFYRYSCQDPENWRNKECNPPSCVADGTCTKYLITIEQDGT